MSLNKMSSKDDPECPQKKEQILNVTLEILKTDGFEGITVRKIAKEAGVNAALINYYFGTKDKLLNFAVQRLIASFKETFAILDDNEKEPKEKLKKFLLAYIEKCKQYPFIVKRLVSDDPFLFDSQKEFFEFIKAIGLRSLLRTVGEISGETDQEKLTIMTSHILGASFLPLLMEPLYLKITGFPFPEAETRIDILLEQYFK